MKIVPTLLAPALLAVVLALGACNTKATLNDSQVETVKVDGRLFEVRIAPTDMADEYRMLVVRATLVINPDPEAERERGWTVAKQYMDRTCKGRRYQVLDNDLTDYVNLQTHFRCLG
ncbi:MAG: hypothetical protein Q8L22_26065 [Reyranella sp.]|nr:hypothetical protein [Reyranella sp.]